MPLPGSVTVNDAEGGGCTGCVAGATGLEVDAIGDFCGVCGGGCEDSGCIDVDA